MGKHIDLTGLRFGKLTVLSEAERPQGKKKRAWLCRCDCGNESIKFGVYLTQGDTKSCGCLSPFPDYEQRSKDKSGKSFVDLTGKRFGKLVVIEKCGTRGSYALWKCQCDCGNTKMSASAHLRGGSTKSCGCLIKEVCGKTAITHGLSKHPLHNRWQDMKARCFNPKQKGYPNYGGRGITVCDEWKTDFKAFYDYCYGLYPDLFELLTNKKEKYEIDRINNDGNYEPGNIRIITKKNNLRNTSRVNYLTIGEDKVPITKVIDAVLFLAGQADSYEMFYQSLASHIRNGIKHKIEKIGTLIYVQR